MSVKDAAEHDRRRLWWAFVTGGTKGEVHFSPPPLRADYEKIIEFCEVRPGEITLTREELRAAVAFAVRKDDATYRLVMNSLEAQLFTEGQLSNE